MQVLHHRQSGKAVPDIVEADTAPLLLQAADKPVGAIHVLERPGFGDLKAQQARGAPLHEVREHFVLKAGVDQAQGRDVDSDGYRAVSGDALYLVQGVGQRVEVDLDDRAIPLEAPDQGFDIRNPVDPQQGLLTNNVESVEVNNRLILIMEVDRPHKYHFFLLWYEALEDLNRRGVFGS